MPFSKAGKIVFFAFLLLFILSLIFCVYYMITKEKYLTYYDMLPGFLCDYVAKPLAYLSGTYIVIAALFKFKSPIAKARPILKKISLAVGSLLIFYYLFLCSNVYFGLEILNRLFISTIYWLQKTALYPAIFSIMAVLIYFGLCPGQITQREMGQEDNKAGE